jgi:dihydrofolate reductase
MGRIVVTTFSSLDGVVQAPGSEEFAHKNWSFEFDRGAEGEQFKVDEALAADALLIGRVTYEGFASAWPNQKGDLADKYNSMPKYVVSKTLTEPAWNNTHVLSGPVADEVATLKKQVDGEIQVPGSIRLVHELFQHDLVDELRIMTFPVILGTGRRLIGTTPDKSAWTLSESRSVGDGVLITIYRRRR